MLVLLVGRPVEMGMLDTVACFHFQTSPAPLLPSLPSFLRDLNTIYLLLDGQLVTPISEKLRSRPPLRMCRIVQVLHTPCTASAVLVIGNAAIFFLFQYALRWQYRSVVFARCGH